MVVNPRQRTRPSTRGSTMTRRSVHIPSMRGSGTENDRDDVLESVVQRGALTTNQIVDPFQQNRMYEEVAGGDFSIQPPPVNLSALLRMPNDSSILRQCIDAMVVNIEGHGYRLEYVGPEGEDQSEAAVAEKQHIEEFLKHLNPDIPLTDLRKRVRWDLETIGFAFIEIGRAKDGSPTSMWHIPAHTMRVTSVDKVDVKVERQENRFGKTIKSTTTRRFRRYVQLIGTRKVYFKELGDPRHISPETGREEPNLPYEDTATEIIFLRQYYPGQLYGLPRWFNNLVAIQLGRQAELTNLDYFKDNAIPALAVLVSGGTLAGDTLESLEQHVTAARGRASQNRVVVIEAEGNAAAANTSGVIPPPRVEIKPLAGERPKEGMFLELDKEQRDKVRSSFRLPPIFTGHAQDYSHASAKTSYEVAEGQVFGPERAVQDDVINRNFLEPYGVKFWEVRSNPPQMSDPEEIISAVEAFDAVGAMTPNIAIGLANEQFGLNIKPVTDDWGNYPFPIVQALATQGKLIGFEDIMKEIEDTNQQVDANGNPVQPVDTSGNGGSGDAQGNSAAKIEDPEFSKHVRRGMDTLREVLEIARKSRYVSPRARRKLERQLSKAA